MLSGWIVSASVKCWVQASKDSLSIHGVMVGPVPRSLLDSLELNAVYAEVYLKCS